MEDTIRHLKYLQHVSLKELGLVTRLLHRVKYPSVPNRAVPYYSFSDKNSKELTKAVKAYFDAYDLKAWRQSSEGRFRPGEKYTDVLGHKKQHKGTWLPGLNVGHGDVSAIVNGIFVSIEVKIGYDKQSEYQKKFEQDVKQSGGLYYIVKTWAGFMEVVTSINKHTYGNR